MLTGCTRFRIPSRVPLSIALWSRSPAQYASKREEERTRVANMFQEPLPIGLDERLVKLDRELPLIFRQQRALHPLDDVLGPAEDVRVDVQAHHWCGESQVEEEARVLVRLEHRLGPMPAVEDAPERFDVGQLFRDAVRRLVVLRRNLKRQLPRGGECGG